MEVKGIIIDISKEGMDIICRGSVDNQEFNLAAFIENVVKDIEYEEEDLKRIVESYLTQTISQGLGITCDFMNVKVY